MKPFKYIGTRHLVLVLVLWTACVYANSLNAPFYLDDEVNIFENPFVRVTHISFDTLSRAAFNSPCPNRPVSNVTFGLNYRLKGYDPAAYRLVNIVLHVITGVMLFLFVKTTIRISGGDGRYGSTQGLAFLTALIWLVHPLQTESVTYIVQRMNIMASMFYLAAFLCYLRGRLATTRPATWAWFSAAIAVWGLALGSKEVALTLPVMILVYEWVIVRDAPKIRARPPVGILAIAFLVTAAALLLYTDFSPLRAVLAGYRHRDFTLLERLLTQGRVIVYYVSLLFYPHPSRLNLVHQMAVSRSLFHPPTTLVAAAAIFAAVIWAVRRAEKAPLLCFCVLWFFGNLAIESSIISLEMVFEHRTYLPSMLAWLLAAVLCIRTVKRPRLAGGLMLAVAVIFSLWTFQRNRLWADEVAFWKDCAKKNPDSVRVYHSLGNAYVKAGKLDEAIAAYKQAVTLKPKAVNSLVGLGHALREKGDIRGAVAVHTKVVGMAPDNASGYNHLGTDYMAENDLNQAIEALKRAVALNPYHYRAYNNLGLAYARRNQPSQAAVMYKKALAIRPDFAVAYNNLGSLYLNPGQAAEAVGYLRKAVSLDPAFPEAHCNLGVALLLEGHIFEGIRELQLTLRLQPTHRNAAFNLARAYELTGNYGKAVKQYQESIRLDPQDAQAHYNAGFICLDHLAQTEAAKQLLKRALSLDPGHAQANAAKKALARLKPIGGQGV